MLRYKKFEYILVDAFKTVPDAIVHRFKDQMSGYFGSKNACDMFVYHWPILFYFEIKSFLGSRFDFGYKEGKPSYNQLNSLCDKAGKPGVIAGFIIWAVDHKRLFFVNTNLIKKLVDIGYKSITVDDLVGAAKEKDTYVTEIECETIILYPKILNPLEFLRGIKWQK